MIAGVRGKVVGRQASSILLEVGGFVLQIGVPLSTLQAAGANAALPSICTPTSTCGQMPCRSSVSPARMS